MEILHLIRGQAPRRLDALDRMPEEGFVWMDFERGMEAALEACARRVVGCDLDRRHVADSQDAWHTAFFDTTSDYDLVIFEEVEAENPNHTLRMSSVAFFVFERLLMTVHDADSASVAVVKRRFSDGSLRSPANTRVMTQIVLDLIAERFVASQARNAQHMDKVEEELLDPKNPFNDWQSLLAGRREVRRFEYLLGAQSDVLQSWHRGSRFEWSNPEETRLRDLSEHIRHARHAAAELERHIEGVVQLYFASLTHRTNEIVRTLTVFSAIFLPLTFVAGIYGMNFHDMPELSTNYGYPAVLVFMVAIVVGLLRYFRRHGYI